MGHDHHSHGAGANSKRLTVVVAIAWLLFAFQLAGAWITGSLALLFDTVHVFTDALSVTVALVAAHLAARPSCRDGEDVAILASHASDAASLAPGRCAQEPPVVLPEFESARRRRTDSRGRPRCG